VNAQRQACYVVLHVGSGPSRQAEQSGSPLIVRDDRRQFALTDDIWIERLNEQVAKNIQRACEPPNYNIANFDYDRHLYAFVRRVPAAEMSNYAGMKELNAVIAFSRLINPTSTGDRYSAHVYFYDAPDSPIFAIQYRGMPDVTLTPNSRRDWLSVEDGETLRKLMPWLSKELHRRVHRARWQHEYAMRSHYMDIRWPFVVAGLEALICVGDDEVARQFCERVQQLADECHVSFSAGELRTAYKMRSKLVHAESFLSGLGTILPENEHLDLYERLESVLRKTVLHCLLDETFGDHFRDDAAVEARWPFVRNVGSKPKAKTTRRKP
jgi:hypothetical protein